MTEDLDRRHRETAELLRLDPDNLSPGDRLRCELISALRAVVDDELAKVTSSRSTDLGKLIIAIETLSKYLAEAQPDADSARLKRVAQAKVNLNTQIKRWWEAENAERLERGLKGLQPSLKEAQARVDDLEVEVKVLRAFVNVKGLLSAYDEFVDALPDNDPMLEPVHEPKVYAPEPMPTLPHIPRVFTDVLGLPPMEERKP